MLVKKNKNGDTALTLAAKNSDSEEITKIIVAAAAYEKQKIGVINKEALENAYDTKMRNSSFSR